MIDFEAIYAALALRIGEIISARRAGTLTGDALLLALAAWDAECRETHAEQHRQTERLLASYRMAENRVAVYRRAGVLSD